jgi:hypothetical protein
MNVKGAALAGGGNGAAHPAVYCITFQQPRPDGVRVAHPTASSDFAIRTVRTSMMTPERRQTGVIDSPQPVLL